MSDSRFQAAFRSAPRAGAARRAFTLIELLMVISIIVLLAGLMVSTLNTVRDRARTVLCMSNIRQIGIAMLTKANDNQNTLATPMDETVDYAFTDAGGNPVAFSVAYPGLPTVPTPYWYRRWQYQCYGFAYDLRTSYGLPRKAGKCPSDKLPFGGNHQKQAWSWATDGMLDKVESDPQYFSSYCADFELLFNTPQLATVRAPGVTFLVTENTIPDAPWLGLWGPDYSASIHGRGRNFHLGESNCFKGMSVFVDGHVEMWDWQRCAYYDTGTLEMTANPSRLNTGVAAAFPGVAQGANLRY